MSKIFNLPSDQFDSVVIGDITNPPSSSDSIFTINSSTKGVVLPRLTNAQMMAIAQPIASMMVYNIDFSCYYFFNSTSWVAFGTGGTGTGGVGPTGPAGNLSTISSMTDVDTVNIQNGSLLIYSQNFSKWTASTTLTAQSMDAGEY